MDSEQQNALDREMATIEKFNEVAYILANIDVALEVMNGNVESGFAHFVEVGESEARQQLSSNTKLH